MLDFLSFVYLNFLRHGYGRWQSIVDDKDLRFQEIICQELNLPVINSNQAGSQSLGSTAGAATGEASGNPPKENGGGSDVTGNVAAGTSDAAANQAHPFQDPAMTFHMRDTQRRQVEFIKKRVLLLEKGLNAEYQKEYFVSISFALHYSRFE